MPFEESPRAQSEPNPEKALSREEVFAQLRSRCEGLEIERELSDAEGIYLLEMMSPDKAKRYVYQRKGIFSGKIESRSTTIRSEDLDDGYSRTIADYDPITGEWVDQ